MKKYSLVDVGKRIIVLGPIAFLLGMVVMFMIQAGGFFL